MPDAFERPGMLRSVKPLVRAGSATVCKFVAYGFPGLSAVVGTMNNLPKPVACLRGIYSVGITRRSLQVIHLKSAKVRADNLPVFTRFIRRQYKSTFCGAHQQSHTRHGLSFQSIMVFFPENRTRRPANGPMGVNHPATR